MGSFEGIEEGSIERISNEELEFDLRGLKTEDGGMQHKHWPPDGWAEVKKRLACALSGNICSGAWGDAHGVYLFRTPGRRKPLSGLEDWSSSPVREPRPSRTILRRRYD